MTRSRRLPSAAPRRRRDPSIALGRVAGELALAVPQVMAHRLTRLALAGPRPSARDRREFHGMWSEKGVAMSQAWQAMALQALRSQQALAAPWWEAWRLAASAPAAPLAAWQAWGARLAQQPAAAPLAILEAGWAPVRRKAVANAKRLRRTPLR